VWSGGSNLTPGPLGSVAGDPDRHRGWLLCPSEVEYDGRVAGIGVSAGQEGDMGRSGQRGGGGKRGVLLEGSWGGAQMTTYFALAGEAR
jgi:hypothetical protein